MSSLGVIVGNEPADYRAFDRWLGRQASFALLAFNEGSPAAFASSIPYIATQGRAFIGAGATVIWSVPCPGSKQLEAIVGGQHDALYLNCAKAILGAYGARDVSPIYVRLPWEFNLPGQPSGARDREDRWNAPLFVAAWVKLARIFQVASPRFRRIWCPNVERQGIDPELCWPGSQHVDIIAQDIYIQKAYSKPGAFRNYFLGCQNGLQWGVDFARKNGKPYALGEYGIDDDSLVGDAAAMFVWIKSLGRTLHHHNWWDRRENIDTKISDGSHPKVGAAYKAAFSIAR